MNGADYLIYDEEGLESIQKEAKCLLQNHSVQGYRVFIGQLLMQENDRRNR